MISVLNDLLIAFTFPFRGDSLLTPSFYLAFGSWMEKDLNSEGRHGHGHDMEARISLPRVPSYMIHVRTLLYILYCRTRMDIEYTDRKYEKAKKKA